jgi:hypothetical protein
MSYPVYYVPSGDVLPIFFDSFDGGTGASITMSGLAVTDIEIYKDGSVTQRASDAGYTLLDTDGIDFDSITGIHGFSIDTGDNTDAGFYTVGAWFHVVVSAITIDAQTVNFIAAAFRLMPAESVAGKPKVDVDAWLGTAAATPTVAGVPEVDMTHWRGTATPAEHTAGYPIVTIKDGTGTGEINTNAGAIALVDLTTTTTTATNVTTVNGLAAGVITAAAIADAAIDAATFAADVDAEILSYIVDDATRIDASDLNSKIDSLTFTVAGDVDVNVQTWGGTAISTPPAVNATQISGDSTAADNLELAYDDTAGAVPWNGISDQGTAQSATATTVVLRAAAAFADSALIGSVIGVLGSTQGYWQFRYITANTLADDTVTVDTWTVTPSGTITYKIYAGPPELATLANVNVTQISGDSTAADNLEAILDGTGGTGLTLSTLTTSGTTTLNALTVSNATTLSGAVSLGSTLGVTGTTTLAALTTTGTVTFNAFTVSNATTLTGNVSLGGTLATTGTVTFNAFTVTNATTLSGAVSLGSTLGVTGTTTLAALTTTGTATFNALTVSNATTLTGAVSLGSTLGVTGTTTLAALTTTGTVTANALTVTNATTLSGAVSLGSTLGVTGAITATNASNNLTLGTFTVTTNAIAWNAAWDTEVQSEVTDALTTALTESYATDGATATAAELLYMIYSAVMEFSISGTTLTCKKLDGSTTAMTVTLNDATNPTSRTRSG